MQLKLMTLDKSDLFNIYLLSDPNVKKLCKEFDFYDVKFIKVNYSKVNAIHFQYPQGNMYWYVDFEKSIIKNFLNDANCKYKTEWKMFLEDLKVEIKNEVFELKNKLNYINAQRVLDYQCKYQLRDYQAFDLAQFIVKYTHWNGRGLILSEPRTGKTRIALAAALECNSVPGSLALVVCPKTAQIGWESEIEKIMEITNMVISYKTVKTISDLKTLTSYTHGLNIRIISYDLFKKFTIPQLRQLTSRNKNITLICDEVHRLRNFKTLQSKMLFDFKTFCEKDNVNLGIIGLTGTIAVKENTDVFGTLALINESKIQFNPYHYCFNSFKEYFYYCEDTSFGKTAKALRREDELRYIIQSCSVQTKQKELSFFKNYKKIYKKVELDLDSEQQIIYNSVYDNMEYDEDIDCQNKLVQLIRLQQVCIDPFGLVSSYVNLSPKLKWTVSFAKRNPGLKFIVACKQTTPLKHLLKVLELNDVEYAYIFGECSWNVRKDNIDKFMNDKNCQVMVLQLDTGKESLTLPAAKVMVFLNRDFAQGFNEQAENRITPVDGNPCVKYIVDLVMKNTKEEMIYNTLVVKKQSINAVNTVFKSRNMKEE